MSNFHDSADDLLNDEEPFDELDYAAVSKAIRVRRTWKVLADTDSLPNLDRELREEFDAEVLESVRESGWAPFHYDRKTDGIPEPWRCYLLRQSDCRKIAARISQWCDDIKPNNKIPAMLSACGSLVLVTWIPQAGSETDSAFNDEKLKEVNEEHLAATAAAVQNLLLLLTARNFGTYWSSGGLLRNPSVFEKLGIAARERLLGAIFVDYTPDQDGVERIPGKLREQRSPPEKWIREINID